MSAHCPPGDRAVSQRLGSGRGGGRPCESECGPALVVPAQSWQRTLGVLTAVGTPHGVPREGGLGRRLSVTGRGGRLAGRWASDPLLPSHATLKQAVPGVTRSASPRARAVPWSAGPLPNQNDSPLNADVQKSLRWRAQMCQPGPSSRLRCGASRAVMSSCLTFERTGPARAGLYGRTHRPQHRQKYAGFTHCRLLLKLSRNGN